MEYLSFQSKPQQKFQHWNADYSRRRDLALFCGQHVIVSSYTLPKHQMTPAIWSTSYHKCLTILSKCVTSRYTNVKLAQGTVYARWTPPAPADKSAINGRSAWEPAASRRHLTSLIMNIHNKSQVFGCSVTLE